MIFALEFILALAFIKTYIFQHWYAEFVYFVTCVLQLHRTHNNDNDNDNDNYNDNKFFLKTKSNEKHHKGNITNTYKIPTLQRSCQGDCTEDIMAASIQPPVIFFYF